MNKVSSIGNCGDLYYKTKIHNRFLYETGKIKKKKNKIRLIKPKKIVSFKEKVETVIKPVIITNEEILHRKLLDIRELYVDEIRVHGEQTLIKEGFVYLIENKSFPGWVKVGMTIDYENRLRSYNQCDPEKRYAIIGLRWTPDRRNMESLILDEISLHSRRREGEWFKIDIDISLNVFYRVIQ